MAVGHSSEASTSNGGKGKAHRKPAQFTGSEAVVVGRLSVKAENVEEFRQIVKGLPEKVRQEPGCLEYAFYQSRKDPSLFSSFERWKSREDFDMHMKGMSALLGQIGPMLRAPPEIVVHHAL